MSAGYDEMDAFLDATGADFMLAIFDAGVDLGGERLATVKKAGSMRRDYVAHLLRQTADDLDKTHTQNHRGDQG